MARLPGAVRRLPAHVRAAAAIETLPERAQLVLALRLVDGLTALETAGALRCSVRTVEREYADALRAVADRLGMRRARRAA